MPVNGWSLNEKDKKKLQTIFNEALKTILYVPNGTPTTIPLSKTGNYPMKYTVMKKPNSSWETHRQHANRDPHEKHHWDRAKWMEKTGRWAGGSLARRKPIINPDIVYSWWRHQLETFSALLALRAGNSPITGEFPAQRPVTRSFYAFFYMRLNTQLSKPSRGWWFETLLRPLWRHCNVRSLGNR